MFVSADRLAAPATDETIGPGAEALFVRVIGQAVEDMIEPTYRGEAKCFFAGPMFRRYCTLLGWDPSWAHRRIIQYVNKEG